MAAYLKSLPTSLFKMEEENAPFAEEAWGFFPEGVFSRLANS